MINRYTADRKPRSDDAYTADALPDKRTGPWWCTPSAPARPTRTPTS
jgi:hypothetical protein